MAKCRPPESMYHTTDSSVCNSLKTFESHFAENVNDAADAVVKILRVFGMQTLKLQAAKSIIIKAFKFYDNKRHCFEALNGKGLSKSEVRCKFQRKCKMSYMEALLAYTVLKRAVKAFFHGTPNFSIRSPVTEAFAVKNQKFIWQHAAARTNQLFECFEHVFSQAPHNYAKRIKTIYGELYERMNNRAEATLNAGYQRRERTEKETISTKSGQNSNAEKQKRVAECDKIRDINIFMQNLPGKEISLTNKQFWSKNNSQRPVHKFAGKLENTKNIELNLPRCYQCNCPQLMCDCAIDPRTGILAVDCSQGSFKCQWVRVNYFDEPEREQKQRVNYFDEPEREQKQRVNYFDEPKREQKQSHICPIDCATSESSSEAGSYMGCDCIETTECEERHQSEEEEKESNSNSFQKFYI